MKGCISLASQKIKSVKCHILQHEYQESFTSARNYWHKKRTFTLVELETEDGIVGWGEALGLSDVIVVLIEKHLAGVVIGEDPVQVEILWDRMYRKISNSEYSGLGIAAISAIDIALWDIIGKMVNEPVYKLLGGAYRKSVEAYATGCFFKSRDFDQIVDDTKKEVRKYVDKGFKKVKMKFGLGVDRDLERIDAVREFIGDDITLMVDSNNSYDYISALKVGREMEKRKNILFFEGPLPVTNIQGHVRLCEALDLPIANGENASLLTEFHQLLASHAVDILQPDLCFAGGLTQGKKIRDLCLLFQVPLFPHVWGSVVGMKAAIQFLATLPDWNSSFFSAFTPLFEFEQNSSPMQAELDDEPLSLENGCIALSDEPGLGIKINREILNRYKI
jgi:D-galactarolactone cycloisomerase